MKRRLPVPVVQARAIPSPAGVLDPVAHNCLEAMKEAIEFMQTDWNPTEKRSLPGGPGGTGAGGGVTNEQITKIIEAALNELRGELAAVLNAGAGGKKYYGRYSVDLIGTRFQLENDEGAPGNNKVYGTNGAGAKGWQAGMPDGSNEGDVAVWDATAGEWVVLDVPAEPAVLAFDPTTGATYWATLDTAYKIIQRASDGTVKGDWGRYHS